MTTPIDIPAELSGNDELLSVQGKLGDIKEQAEVAIAEDIEEDRLTQNTAPADEEEEPHE